MNSRSYINNFQSYWLLFKFNDKTNIENNTHILDAKKKTMSQLQQCKDHNIIYIYMYYNICILLYFILYFLYTHTYVVGTSYILYIHSSTEYTLCQLHSFQLYEIILS